MKKTRAMIMTSACIAAMLSTMPLGAFAEDETLVYGTMDIPYADFYANEGIGYAVDAVSSATTSKWASNEEGGLVQGTFHEANEDGTGTILGVTYPVAITSGDLASLGADNYHFTELDSVPAAYKQVTVSDGAASFSSVVGSTDGSTTTVTVETASHWGDYCITIDSLVYERGAAASSIGKLYGCIVTDTDGNNYAMRHLENIWKNELGINVLGGTADAHGAVSYENFASLNGGTIDTITYITENGYYIYDVDPDAYLAKKVTGGVAIADADIAAGRTSVTEDLPSDYEAEYTLEGLTGSVSNGVLTYSGAMPGSYTAMVSDRNGVYESLTVTFVLTTDSMPAAYADGSIVKADGAEDADFENFLANIATVTVNGESYAASGRGSVTIINEDGTIDFYVSSNGVNVFDGSGEYTVIVAATGYTQTLEFVISSEDGADDSSGTNDPDSTFSDDSSDLDSTSSSDSSSDATSSTASEDSSPKTGSAGVAVPAVLAALAAAASVALAAKKKK